MSSCRDEHEFEVEVLRDKSSYATFSTASVPEGRRLLQRYMGHCNIQTDIKEVTFLGDNDELVAAGEHEQPFMSLPPGNACEG